MATGDKKARTKGVQGNKNAFGAATARVKKLSGERRGEMFAAGKEKLSLDVWDKKPKEFEKILDKEL
jgi:hypothetical protein